MGYSDKFLTKDFRLMEATFLFLSPHFPPRFRFFIRSLREKGATVLGIGDEPYGLLHDDVRFNVKEYYYVTRMENYEEVYRAVGHLIHNHGRIHYIESLNEHWLETEARLRLDFNIPGYKPTQLEQYKRKSGMKRIFKDAGLAVAPGLLASNVEEAIQFAKSVGYPFILKPDIGVGAFGARKLNNEEELKAHWQPDYFVEKFIQGDIETFDGLTDSKGEIVFYNSLGYSSGIMEILQGSNEPIWFYARKDVPEDLLALGSRVVQAFEVRSRFFHIEFFRTAEGLLPLEVNLRPPGGITVDMWNYGHRCDMYSEYANVITNRPTTPFKKAQFYCVYTGRRYNLKYKHSFEDIAKKLGKRLELRSDMPKVFSAVMGDEAYVFVCDSPTEMKEFVSYIDERAQTTVDKEKEKEKEKKIDKAEEKPEKLAEKAVEKIVEKVVEKIEKVAIKTV